MWIDVKESLPDFSEETKVIALFKQDNSGWCGMPVDFADRVEKVWWIPQRRCFAFEDIENANHMVTHWFEIPAEPVAA